MPTTESQTTFKVAKIAIRDKNLEFFIFYNSPNISSSFGTLVIPVLV
jgi:hypothetical protein